MKNEPAFPTFRDSDSRNVKGMTLRDYFAAKAMQAFCTDPLRISSLKECAREHGLTLGRELALQAYDLADAMLEERNRKGE